MSVIFFFGAANAAHHEETSMSPNVLAAKAGYDAFGLGDMDAWKEAQDPEAVWVIQKGLPYSGTYVGPQAVMDNVFASIEKLWPDFKVQPINFYESGDTVFVHIKMTAENLDSESIHMVTLRDGKYIRFQPFDDSALMMDAAKK